ncbi:MAG: PQQ-binding-like beta-propeller repeat protein [Dehalobacterium sp.]
MRKRIFGLILCFCLLIPGLVYGESFKDVMPTVVDPNYEIRTVVPPADIIGGTNGLAFDSKDNLYVGAVAGVATYKVDTNTGAAGIFLGGPEGGADDIVFGPDGRMYWNAFFLGKLFTKSADGEIVTLAENLPGMNSLAFDNKGRLYATQVFMGDALWRIDLTGNQKNVKTAENLGGLNGFDFGKDGYLYGPLWFKGQVVKVNVDTGKVEVVADGFTTPAAVNFDSKGNLFAIDTATGEVIKVDVETGKKTVIVKMEPKLDNLDFDSKDRLYVTNSNANGIYEVDVATGKVRTVTEGRLCFPQGIAVANNPDGDMLYIADNFAYKRVDAFTGEVFAPNNHSSYPYAASISEDGQYILMSSWFSNTVQVYDRKTDEQKYVISGFNGINGTLMLADGSILAAEEATGNIVKVTDQEGKERSVVAAGLKSPTYMALAGQDAIYVTEFTAGRVTKVNLKTGDKKVICSGLLAPKGIAVNTNGKILVLDSAARQLLEIDPATGISKPLVINLAVGLQGFANGGPAAYSLTGVAASKSGSIYITSDLANTIYKISPK